MRYAGFAAVTIICTMVSQAALAAEPRFAERVVAARTLQATKAVRDYQRTAFFPTIGPSLQAAMAACLARTGAKGVRLVLVADVTDEGRFTRVAHQPDTPTAACVAQAVETFKAPPPPDHKTLPITIEMILAP